MTNTTFSSLPLSASLQRAVAEKGYTTPTPIQVQAIPPLVEGRDLLGIAQTGTGKTAAFALPILERLAKAPRRRGKAPRVLVLGPTRELAAQVKDNFEAYAKHTKVRCGVIFGGVGPQPQVDLLRRGLDVLVATPGRLLDLMGQGHVDLSALEVFVLDEADRMLDMGFIHDVRRVMKALPKDRHSLLFSATMPPDIAELAGNLLKDPVRVEVTPPSTTVERIEQRVLFVEKPDKPRLLEVLLGDRDIERSLVFTRTKHGANRVAKKLVEAQVTAEAIHGNKSQTARTRALANFKSGATRVLVATDIAARGIDIPGVTHVINFDLPNVPESYVHRIGRTARAGQDGVAISFCDEEERAYLRDIEKKTGQKVPVTDDHPYRSTVPFERSSRGNPAPHGRRGPARPPADPAATPAGRRRRRRRR
jgi:ATP-dependent RNA helicase RhlE